MNATQGPTLTISLPPSLGKSGLAMKMAMECLQRGYHPVFVHIETPPTYFVARHLPAPHDPLHTPVQRMGEGIRRVCDRVQRMHAPHGTGLAKAGALLAAMGQQATLWHVIVPIQQDLPGQGRTMRHARSTKLSKQHDYLLQTPMGFFDELGRHSISQEAGLRRLNLPRRKPPMRALAPTLMQRMADRVQVSFAWPPMGLEILEEEMALALLESGTPVPSIEVAPRRL